MRNKSVFIIMTAFAGMLLLAGNITAAIKTSPLHSSSDADEQWTPLGYGLLGQDYANPEHWWHDVVPTALQKAKIDRVPGPIINSVVDINQVFIGQGNDDVPGSGKLQDKAGPIQYPPCTVTLTTGADVNSQLVMLGYYYADHGTLQIDDGVMDVNTHVFVGYEGRGDLIMNGGTLNVYGNFTIAYQGGTGRAQLNGGTLHLQQFSYEYPYKEPGQWLITDPITLPHIGKASMDISGGKIIHDSNATDGPGISDIYWRMVNEGKLTAYNGLGSVLIAYDPCTFQTTVTGQKMLWNYSDITVTSNSTMDNDITFGLDKMFDVNGSDAAIFLSAGAGAVYTVDWKTPAPVTVTSFEMVANRDDVNNLNHRAISHFTLKAKGVGSSTYNLTLVDKNIAYPAGSDVTDQAVALGTPVTAQEFHAEFTGADVNGPRINKLNAIGTRTDEQLWNLSNGDISLTNYSPVINDPLHPGMYDIANMFESGSRDVASTIFIDGTGAGYVYFVEFATPPETINSIKLVTERDAVTNSRATTHFKLKSKSIGATDWDAVPLYDGDIDYATGDVNTLNITLPSPVTAQQFRAEFTGGVDSAGVRVRELDAVGVKNGDQLWEPDNVVIGDHSATDWNAGLFNIENAFQKEGVVPDSNFISALFYDNIPGSGVGSVDYVEWKTRSKIKVTGFQLIATHDAYSAVPHYGRAMSNFKLWTKSSGSSAFDVLVYDSTTTIAPPYGGSPDGNTLNLFVPLATPIIAGEFRAEFTRYLGGIGSGVRVGELNAYGYKLPAAGDLSGDNDVDFQDFALFAKDWRVDNSGGTQPTTVLDNFEAGIGNWTNWASHSTSQNYNFFYSNSSIVHSGTKSMMWTYYLDDSGPVLGDDDSGVVFTAASPIDIKNFSKFRVWLYRQAGNSNENYIAVRFYSPGLVTDSRLLAEAFILSANGSTKTPSSIWNEWVVDLRNDLVFQNPTLKSLDDLSKVGTIVLEVCNRLSFVGGPGTIYVDDMALTGRCAGPASDFNGDCKVDINDLVIFCDNWLVGK
jgi:hypothetical protein